jgi:hypothetical protein
MKNTIVLALVGLLTPAILLTGCDKTSTESSQDAKTASARHRPPPLPPPTAGSNQRRLTTPQEDVNLHVIAAQSNFTQTVHPVGVSGVPQEAVSRTQTAVRPRVAPELIPRSGLTINNGIVEEHDWSGTVLVPKDLTTALAFTSKVQVQYIEVHPLNNGSVRIWSRLINRTGHKEKIQIGCAFRTNENPDSTSPRFYEIDLPEDYIDVFFVSPKENINAYTFLIRNSKEDTQGGK